MKRTKRLSIGKLLLATILLIFALSAIFPFVIMVLMSFSQKTDMSLSFKLSEFTLKNYKAVLGASHFGRYFLNSMIIVSASCFFNCLFGSMAAYPLAKKRFPGRDKLLTVYIASMMIPGQVILIPIFVIMKKLGLINTYVGLIIPFINAYGVFLIRQFMVNVPNELLEAARIDGCNEWRMFTSIIIPLIKPVLISLTIFTFLTSWSDYIWALILTTTEKMQTLTLSVANLKGAILTNYGLIMAGATISFMPPFILYVILQKQFVEGVALSGIKG